MEKKLCLVVSVWCVEKHKEKKKEGKKENQHDERCDG
jgi:hypothetical protein